MRMLEFFRSSAVRVALAFVLVTTLATTVVFALVYFRIGEWARTVIPLSAARRTSPGKHLVFASGGSHVR